MSTTIHLTAHTLRGLLAPVLPFAGDNSMPILETIQLRGHGDHLTAFTTDRYRAAIQRVKATAPEFEALLPVTAARQMLATFKPSRSHDPDLTLTFTDGRVHVETDAIADGLFDARIGYGLYRGEYPRVGMLLTDAADAEPVPLVNYFVTSALLADFAKAAPTAGPMRLHVGQSGDDNRLMLLISIGDDFRGILMPCRSTEQSKPLLDDSWRALLTEPPKAEAAPVRKPRTRKAAS